MRRVWVMWFVGSAAAAHADPAAAPPPPPSSAPGAPAAAPVSVPGEGLSLRAGFGFGRYSESTANLLFEANLEPEAQIGAEWSTSAGRGQFAVQAAASLGTQVDMQATSQGTVTQQNQFRQEVYEASPRLRWPLSTPGLVVEAGYRLTYQRLFFLGVPNVGDAEEDVTVHALEFGGSWQRTYADGSHLRVGLGLGFNHGSALNNRITGGDFSALGHSFWVGVHRRFASRLSMEAGWTYRQQHGSTVQNVMFMGMPGQAVWPQNTTWTFMGFAGYGF
jgi:hypothetical protein